MWSKVAFQAAQIGRVAKSSFEICRRGEDVVTPLMSEIPRILGAQRRKQKLKPIMTSDSRVKNARIQPRILLCAGSRNNGEVGLDLRGLDC